MQLRDFHFNLPQELIARYPLPVRSASRLLCINKQQKEFAHKQFNEILSLIEPGDLLIFNDTKVIPARLFGQKATGGKVELLVERILNKQSFLAQIRASKLPRVGEQIFIGASSLVPENTAVVPVSAVAPAAAAVVPRLDRGIQENLIFHVVSKKDQFYELHYGASDKSVLEIIETVGEIPLPPYMHRTPEDTDKERYQTIYAKHKGSVAAPTAGLHFDDELLQKLTQKHVEFGYLTLHIGAGTFAPIRVENILEHKMHTEYLEISTTLCQQIKKAKAKGKRIIAVGTTSLRALETAQNKGDIQPFCGETNIFIYPGYQFGIVDALITNMHLPSSTLMMLVCAFGGHELMMRAYKEAVAKSYRFYSYGDAMFII